MITLHFHLQPQYKYELFHIKLHKDESVVIFTSGLSRKLYGRDRKVKIYFHRFDYSAT